MSVSFEVVTNNSRTLKFNDRACFAHINNILDPRDREYGIRIHNIKYKPFFGEQYCEDAECYVEDIRLSSLMGWSTASRWWSYLMSLPFISDCIVDSRMPNNIVAYKAGFRVKSDVPADRMMLVLFLLRLPQFQAGIVRQWDRLVRYHKAQKDTAFVLALGLNNTLGHDYESGEATSDPELRGSEEKDRAYRLDMFNPTSCAESTVLYPEYTTVRTLKILLNRLVNEEYDNQLFNGIQGLFRDTNRYHRAPKSDPECLGRFFAKKGATAYRRGNFMLTVAKDILQLEGVYRFGDLRYVSLPSRHITSDQMQQIISLIEN